MPGAAPLDGARDGLWRRLSADPEHGPLPVLLLALTVVTGVIDAVSILALGRVFVANMTGNVVFVGFALAGAPGFSLAASLAALLGFLVGAGAGGTLAARIPSHRGRLLRAGVCIEAVLFLAALVIVAVAGEPFTSPTRDLLAALAAVAMGLQNAVVRKLGVPDLTTTVLTMTLTGIAADVRASGWQQAVIRVLAVATMLGGALIGALLVLHASTTAAMVVVAALVVAVAITASALARRSAPWH